MSEAIQVIAGQTFRKIDPRNGRASYYLRDTTHHWMYTVTRVADGIVYFRDDAGDRVDVAIDAFLNSFDPVSEYGTTLLAHKEHEALHQRIIELEKRVSQLEAARAYRTSPFNTEPDMGR